jgi:heme A synthase
MFFVHFLFAVIVALLLSLIFVKGVRRDDKWPGFILTLVVIFLAAWAGGLWISPFGPTLWDAAILPFMVSGLLALLLVAGLAMGGRRSTVEFAREEGEERPRPGPMTAIGAFFWILLVILFLAVLLGYVVGPEVS